MEAVRRLVHDFYREKKYPTLDSLLLAAKEKGIFSGERAWVDDGPQEERVDEFIIQLGSSDESSSASEESSGDESILESDGD